MFPKKCVAREGHFPKRSLLKKFVAYKVRELVISYSECPADSVEFDLSPCMSPIPGGAGAYTVVVGFTCKAGQTADASN